MTLHVGNNFHQVMSSFREQVTFNYFSVPLFRERGAGGGGVVWCVCVCGWVGARVRVECETFECAFSLCTFYTMLTLLHEI